MEPKKCLHQSVSLNWGARCHPKGTQQLNIAEQAYEGASFTEAAEHMLGVSHDGDFGFRIMIGGKTDHSPKAHASCEATKISKAKHVPE